MAASRLARPAPVLSQTPSAMRAGGVNQQTRPAFVKQRAHAQRGRCAQPDANHWRPCASRAPLRSLAGLGAGAQAFADHDGDASALRSATASAAGP
jgi:hypothetical protein